MSTELPAVEPMGDEERDLSGETVMGMRVAAYRRWHHFEHMDPAPEFSTHWSTPGPGAERLFLEADVRARLDAAEANAKKLDDYAFEATKAITGLVGGGSEMFAGKIGDRYIADLPYCVERLKDRLNRADKRSLDQTVRRMASEAEARRLREAGREVADKLWVLRCDSPDPLAREAAEKAIEMWNAALKEGGE